MADSSPVEKRGVIVRTAGDLWKAYREGFTPCTESSGDVSIRRGENTPTIACRDDAAEAKRITLDRAQALVAAEGGDKAAAIERLIARVQLQTGMDKANVINMPLAMFVAKSQDNYQPDPVLEPIRDAIGAVRNGVPHSKGADDAYKALVAALQNGRKHRPAIITELAAGEIDALASNLRYERTPEASEGLERWQERLRKATLYGEKLDKVTQGAKQMARIIETPADMALAGILAWAATGAEPADNAPTPTKAKRSTERGEGREKLIAALTKHHKYADGGCLNLEPIGNNELAKLADVGKSTASAFFREQFDGYGKYRAKCQDAGKLVDALKALRGEFTPAELSQMTVEAYELGNRQADED